MNMHLKLCPSFARHTLAAFSLLLPVACGSRPEAMDTAIANVTSVALESSFALVDPAASRVLLVQPQSDDGSKLARTSVKVGKNAVNAAASSDNKSLFVLATGVLRPENADDEGPSLTIIGEGGASQRLELGTPLSGLSVDPKGRWLAIYPSSESGAFVQNPNQIILVDLKGKSGRPELYPRTIRSFGGRPQRLTFSAELSLPLEKTSLLAIETDQDLTLLDLGHHSPHLWPKRAGGEPLRPGDRRR
jgi:hypothetical protein